MLSNSAEMFYQSSHTDSTSDNLISFSYATRADVISHTANCCQIQLATKYTEFLIMVLFNYSKIHGINHMWALMHWICVTADLLSGREESHR